MALFFFSPFVCASSSPHNKKMEMLQLQHLLLFSVETVITITKRMHRVLL